MTHKLGWRALLLTGLAAVLIAGCGGNEQGQEHGSDHEHQEGQTPATATEIKINHMHGLGYSADGSSLYVANHGAFLVHQADAWQPPVNPHDFMGMSATEKALYVSGHPGTKDLKNPLGLAKSTDGGKTVQPLAFHGEIDFHNMVSSYYTGTIYVFNDHAHPKLKEGLHYTKDEGKTWTHVKISGLNSPITAMAVHPRQDNLLIFGTEKGIAISEDYGATIKTEFNTSNEVTALTYGLSPDESQNIYVATTGDKTELHRITPDQATFKKDTIFSGDKNEGITYIAANPHHPELALTTDKNNILRVASDGTPTALTEQGTVKIGKK